MTSRRPRLTTASRRILYSGGDYVLAERLKDALKPLDCFVVGSPVSIARTFIKSDIKYTLLLNTIKRHLPKSARLNPRTRP